MADTKVSGLTAITTLASGDLLTAVDISDTTMAATGTNKKITAGNFLANIALPVGIDSSLTVNDSGSSVDFRVESNTKTHAIVVDGSADRVGLCSTALPTATLDIDNGKIIWDGTDQLFFNNSIDAGLIFEVNNTNVGTSAGANVWLTNDGGTSALTLHGSNRTATRFGGAVSVANKLEINGSNNGGLILNGSLRWGVNTAYLLYGDGTGLVFNESAAGLDFRFEGLTDAQLLMLDASADRVGVGVLTPAAKLDVDGSAIFNNSGAAVDFRVEGDTDANLLFVDGSTDRIGLGTASPEKLLHLVGSDPTIRARDTANNAASYLDIINVSDGQSRIDHVANTGSSLIDISPISTDNSSAQNVRFFRNSSSAPTSTVQVLSPGTSTALHQLSSTGAALFNNAGAAADFTVQGDTDANLLFVDGSTDRLGVGTASPNEKLTVNGSLSIVDGMTAPTATSGWAKIFVDTADGDLKIIFGDGTTKTIVTDT